MLVGSLAPKQLSEDVRIARQRITGLSIGTLGIILSLVLSIKNMQIVRHFAKPAPSCQVTFGRLSLSQDLEQEILTRHG
jgi:hypothetical protein